MRPYRELLWAPSQLLICSWRSASINSSTRNSSSVMSASVIVSLMLFAFDESSIRSCGLPDPGAFMGTYAVHRVRRLYHAVPCGEVRRLDPRSFSYRAIDGALCISPGASKRWTGSPLSAASLSSFILSVRQPPPGPCIRLSLFRIISISAVDSMIVAR